MRQAQAELRSRGLCPGRARVCDKADEPRMGRPVQKRRVAGPLATGLPPLPRLHGAGVTDPGVRARGLFPPPFPPSLRFFPCSVRALRPGSPCGLLISLGLPVSRKARTGLTAHCPSPPSPASASLTHAAAWAPCPPRSLRAAACGTDSLGVPAQVLPQTRCLRETQL